MASSDGVRVDREHARPELDRAGLGRQIAELTDRVVGIRLGHQHDVSADLLQLDDVIHGFLEAAGVVQRKSDSHFEFIAPNRLVDSLSP
jgi:hypothetical protein